jgi:hypothetical protein
MYVLTYRSVSSSRKLGSPHFAHPFTNFLACPASQRCRFLGKACSAWHICSADTCMCVSVPVAVRERERTGTRAVWYVDCQRARVRVRVYIVCQSTLVVMTASVTDVSLRQQ